MSYCIIQYTYKIRELAIEVVENTYAKVISILATQYAIQAKNKAYTAIMKGNNKSLIEKTITLNEIYSLLINDNDEEDNFFYNRLKHRFNFRLTESFIAFASTMTTAQEILKISKETTVISKFAFEAAKHAYYIASKNLSQLEVTESLHLVAKKTKDAANDAVYAAGFAETQFNILQNEAISFLNIINNIINENPKWTI